MPLRVFDQNSILMQFITEHTVGAWAELCARQSYAALTACRQAAILPHDLPHLTTDSEQTFCRCRLHVPFIYFQLNYFHTRFAIIDQHLAVSGDSVVEFIQ